METNSLQASLLVLDIPTRLLTKLLMQLLIIFWHVIKMHVQELKSWLRIILLSLVVRLIQQQVSIMKKLFVLFFLNLIFRQIIICHRMKLKSLTWLENSQRKYIMVLTRQMKLGQETKDLWLDMLQMKQVYICLLDITLLRKSVIMLQIVVNWVLILNHKLL